MAQIIPLSEGVFTIGHDKVFMPFDTETEVLTDRSRGSLLVEVVPFLVVTSKDVLVLDTGLGFNTGEGKLQIHENLRSHGYSPGDITKVLMTHLHKDHAGGIMYKDGTEAARLTFPYAEYFVYGKEAAYALNTGYPSYHPEELDPLLTSDQVRWLEGEEGWIDDYIRFYHSGGHSPEHIVYLIEDGGDKIFFGGDEAPQLKQLKVKYMAKYDFNGKRAMELREQYAAKGRAEGWQFLFYHDISTPVASL
jgi:glyoxylase-like metal-dependent hydrolase (beta-lactamase superfamily II)